MKTDRNLGIAIAIVSALGLCVAGYLAYHKLFGGTLQCVAGHGCQIVQKSKYATFLGVPVPYIGFVGWIGILLSLLVPGDIGRGITAAMTLFGALFTIYLTYLELFEIHAICPWCVTNGVLMVIAAGLSIWRLLAYQPPILAAISADDQNE
ncbi:MAG: vitamin K epoxide reductase family protein [Solirubrobacterales bacterium]